MDRVPFTLLIPEEQFLEELAGFLLARVDYPKDNKWREVRLTFEVRCVAEEQPKIQGFLLGGRHAS